MIRALAIGFAVLLGASQLTFGQTPVSETSASETSSLNALRVATWNVELSRKGPGILMRDIATGEDPQVLAVLSHIRTVDPDVLLLTGMDTDPLGHTLSVLQNALAQNGQVYPHTFTRLGNAGLPTGRDLDQDGRAGEPQDAQSYGEFRGVEGMAVLSRLPILEDQMIDFTELLWRDFPSARIPEDFYSDEDLDVLRLSSNSHWDLPVLWQGAPLHLFAYHAGTPVFDGEEDRNGKRNADENALWLAYLDGALDAPAPSGPFVILGDSNLDPIDGEGLREQMQTLLQDPRLQDPKPRSNHGLSIANPEHDGDAALDTVDWNDPTDERPGPGNLRVDYVLPSHTLTVVQSGITWAPPLEGDLSLRHGLVWVDIAQFP